MPTFKELTDNMPEKFNGVFKTIVLMIVGVIIVKIFGLNRLGIPPEDFPSFLRWLTVSKILVIAMAFMLMKYGWKKPDRGLSKIAEEIMVFYEGTARVAGTLIAIAALVNPLKSFLIGFLFPLIIKGEGIKWARLSTLGIWYVVWLIVLIKAIKKDSYKNMMGDLMTSEGMQNLILGLIRFIVMLPLKIFRRR